MKKYFLILFLLVFSKIALASVIINEIMYNPIGSDSGREWLEVYSNKEVNLSEWSFFEDEINHGLELINGIWIIKGYAVIVSDWENFLLDFPNFNGTLIDSSWSSLSNSGEYIAIKNEKNEIINGINYSTGFANGNSKSLSLINNTWVEANPTPGYENYLEEELKKTQDIKLEVNIEDEINLGIEQTNLFKITNLNQELGKVYNISVYYNITKDNVLVKEDIFVKDEVNYYSTTDTGNFLPEEIGSYEICGRIINSSANSNIENDFNCKFFSVIDTSSVLCNITINITTDREIYLEGETVKFNNNLNNKEYPYVIEYWIEDFFGNVYKNPYNTTNTNQKSWKTKIEEEDRVLFVKANVYPNCNDTNLDDNYAEKMFIVKSNSSEEDIIEEKNENSSLEIVEVDDKVKFGETADIKVKVYKGNTGKYSISLWVEGDNKISEVTKIHIYDKYSSYNGQLPVELDNNCDGKLGDGDYDVVLSGLGLEAREKIKIEGVKTSLCTKTATTSSSSTQKKKFEYELVSNPNSVKAGEEFIVEIEVENNDDKDYEVKVWSYVYRGSKSYSGEREGNMESFILESEKKKIVELSNVVMEAESGQYNLKVKVNKNNQKTDYEITKPITIESVKEESVEKKNIKQEIEKKKKTKIKEEFRPEIIYESSTYRLKKIIGYFIIGILSFLSVVLIWKR